MKSHHLFFLVVSTISFAQAASITTPPSSQNVSLGQPFSLSVVATGTGTITYQWQKDGVNIPAATGSSYNITSAQPWNVGDYVVKVTDTIDTATSGAVRISIGGINSGLWLGLMAYYPFKGNANDTSSNAFHGIPTNAVLTADRESTTSAAYAINSGSDGWVEVQQVGPFGTLARYTISAWVHITGDNFVSRILSNEGPDFSGQRGFRLYTTATQYYSGGATGDFRPKFAFGSGWGGGGDGIDGTTSFSLGTWHHVVGTYDGVTATLYVNGSQEASGLKAGWELSSLAFLQIGRFKGSTNYPHYTGLFAGSVDDVRIYNRALSNTEVATLYSAENVSNNWRQQYFGTTSITGNAANDADPDKDSLVNLLELTLNLNPNIYNSVPASVQLNGSNLEYTYTRGTAAFNGGKIFQVEWSETLVAATWSSAGVVEEVLSDNGTVQQVKTTLPAGTNGRRFVRLRVE